MNLTDVNFTGLDLAKPFVGYPYDASFVNNSSSHASTTTWLFYFAWGNKYPRGELGLYQGDFKAIIPFLSERDLVIFDAGNHYGSDEIDRLEKAADFFAATSQESKAMFIYMETSPEEWKTSNGMFAHRFAFRTKCEALTPARVRGTAMVDPEDMQRANNSGDLKDIAVFRSKFVPKYDAIGYLYPEMFHANKTPKLEYVSESCIPDCLPPDWRSRVVISRFRNAGLTIVPTWRQFLARPHVSTTDGDCTHPALDGIIEKVFQLYRTMKRS
jgi:hypothetical protein